MSEKVLSKSPEADFFIGGTWGDAIHWSAPEEFKDIQEGKKFKAYGFKSIFQKKPKVGDTLCGEFIKSWIIFEIVSFKRESNPADMFWIEAIPIDQVIKEEFRDDS